jgi:two-component system sensor histidine kinase BaeS
VRSIVGRVVLLAVVVALASTLVTAVVVVQAAGAQNAAEASATAAREAESLAAVVEARAGGVSDATDLPTVRALQRVIARRGATATVARPAGGFAVSAPFTSGDVSVARATGSVSVRRDVGGTTWAVAGRQAGRAVTLVAEPIAPARRLTAAQRRQVGLMIVLGLLGGGLAGLLLARGVTRPLARVADAARRLTAGERDVRVPVEGPAEVGDVAVALDALSSALGRSEARQRQFLLAVSHELRTPLTSVSGWAEAMADGALDARDVPGAAAVVRDEAARLQRRVEDLLALARLEADDFHLERGPVDVAAVLWAAADAFAPRAHAGGVDLRVEAPATGPVISSDGERLRQAVDALADNAMRVLPPGAPLVFACRAGDPGWVRIEVRDGGPGLSPDDLAVAFDRGVLTERYRGARAVGSGLGLALVGELARRLGGRAEAHAAPEGGVAFAVILPTG